VRGDVLLEAVEAACRTAARPPKVLLLSFPNNPTTLQAPPGFFERAVEVCRRNRLLLIHDFAYADFGFGEEPPSVLQVPGAKEIAVEFFSMSKSYCMAGWRVGFCVGNPAMVGALTRIKSYLDYGIFQPIQIAAAHALQARGCRRWSSRGCCCARRAWWSRPAWGSGRRGRGRCASR
jgi:alanine-synthesizing transaminase